MVIFSPQPLKIDFFFVKATPQEESKCKNAQFCNGFYKLVMFTFKKWQNLKFEEIIS